MFDRPNDDTSIDVVDGEGDTVGIGEVVDTCVVEGDDVGGDVTVSVGAEVAGSTTNVDSTVGGTEEVPTVAEDSEEAEDLPDNTSTPTTTPITRIVIAATSIPHKTPHNIHF